MMNRHQNQEGWISANYLTINSKLVVIIYLQYVVAVSCKVFCLLPLIVTTPGNDRTNNRLCKNKKDSFLNCHPCHYICNLRINSTYGIRPAVGHKSWILSHAWHQRLSILHILMGYTLPIKKRYIRYVGKLRSIWIRSDWRRDKRMLPNLHLGTKTNVWSWICPKPNQAM